MEGPFVARVSVLALVSACAACASVAAPETARQASVQSIVAQVKCEIAAGLRHTGDQGDARRRVKGWASKSILELKKDQFASAGAELGVTPLAPAPSFNLGFGSGEGYVETSTITFTDDLDRMGKPFCANGTINPSPDNNLGLAAWLSESLNAFGSGNKTEFRQLGRTIVFTATYDAHGKVAFAVAPASLSLQAARRFSDTHTLTIALEEKAGTKIYQVRILGTTPPDSREHTFGSTVPPAGRTPGAPRGAISDTTRQGLDQLLQDQRSKFRSLD